MAKPYPKVNSVHLCQLREAKLTKNKIKIFSARHAVTRRARWLQNFPVKWQCTAYNTCDMCRFFIKWEKKAGTWICFNDPTENSPRNWNNLITFLKALFLVLNYILNLTITDWERLPFSPYSHISSALNSKINIAEYQRKRYWLD